jgi:phosphoglycolate phosphatase
VPALLERLLEADLRLAIATSKPEQLARKIVGGVGLAGYIELVGGADHVAGRVGKAAVVGSVIERLGVDPAREPVVMVGDRHHDVDGAAEHGIPTIGVAWGYAEPGELDSARLVVTDVQKLAEALRGDVVWSTVPPAQRS